MIKFEYVAFDGWKQLMLYSFRLKENPKIKKIKADATQGSTMQSLNIMGQHGWELISSPSGVGKVYFIFKKKI